MMPGSPIVMWVRYDEERPRRYPVNPDLRERPVRGRECRPDPIGVRMARLPADEIVDDVDRRIDRGQGKLRESIAFFLRRLAAAPFPAATGER